MSFYVILKKLFIFCKQAFIIYSLAYVRSEFTDFDYFPDPLKNDIYDDLYKRFNGLLPIKRENPKSGQSSWYYMMPVKDFDEFNPHLIRIYPINHKDM